MERSIGVGLIIGLVIATSIYVKESASFTKLQKTILLICIVFPPIQWIGILFFTIYNKIQSNNSSERISQKRNELAKKELDSSLINLKELKQKGILSEEEYKHKIKKVEDEIIKEDIINSKEYKQLKSLLNQDILSKDEFEEKKKILLNKNIKSNNNEISNTYLVSGKEMTIEQIELEFHKGNYILDRNTLIEVDGLYKTIYEIPSFRNITRYFPPKNNE